MEVVVTTPLCLLSKEFVVGLEVGLSVLEVRYSFHSKYMNYEGMEVCGGGRKGCFIASVLLSCLALFPSVTPRFPV